MVDRESSSIKITEEELKKLLIECGEQPITVPEASGVRELVEQRAREHGEWLAVCDGGENWSYAELNRRANQVAWKLMELGVGPEVAVAVCMDRGKEMLAAFLGILKAGGAFVPIDPAYPEERIKRMLSESASRVLLLGDDPVKGIMAPLRVLSLNLAADSLKGEKEVDPPAAVSGESIAYIIFTSGSTGMPKGVAIPHRALVHHNRVIGAAFGLRPSDRVLQFCSPGFDVMVEEVFATWAAGGAVVLKNKAMTESMPAFLREVERLGLTVLNLPTAFWQHLVDEMSDSGLRMPSSVRLVIAGGEKVSPVSLARWIRLGAGSVRWINGYGPTETTITTHLFELPPGSTPESWENAASVPIGRPVANTRCYVLDPHGNSAPVGEPGELHIGGPGLARGYLNQPALTAEKFVPSKEGGRLFKTGDWVRLLPSGDLEFLGRMDDQVKIRGFRIETEEIETILRQHPSIRGAVVAVRPDHFGHPTLVAYYTLRSLYQERSRDLRKHLLKWLPDYMVPSAFVCLPSFPLTPHGKIDRAALPAPSPAAGEDHSQWVEPRDLAEESVAQLWRELLGLEKISVYSNFFELGGHSLLATRLMTRVSRVFQMDLSQRVLFENPTIAQLASFIRDAQAAHRMLVLESPVGDSTLVEGEL